MDSVTKLDNSKYTATSTVQNIVTYSVEDDRIQLETLQSQLEELESRYQSTRDTISLAISAITDRLTAASNAGVSDATLVLSNQSNDYQG